MIGVGGLCCGTFVLLPLTEPDPTDGKVLKITKRPVMVTVGSRMFAKDSFLHGSTKGATEGMDCSCVISIVWIRETSKSSLSVIVFFSAGILFYCFSGFIALK